MSGHPCRAHHKLEWARKKRSVLVVLYKNLPRSESVNSIISQRLAAHPNFAMSTLFDMGWQQPLNHSESRPARRVKDAEDTVQPLVLDSARWLCYLSVVHQSHTRLQTSLLKEDGNCLNVGVVSNFKNKHLSRRCIHVPHNYTKSAAMNDFEISLLPLDLCVI